MLILDGDGIDSRNYSKEQTRLRLEAFLEMLEAKTMITAGVDIGSLTAKAVILKDGEIAGYAVMPGGSDVTAAAGRVLAPGAGKSRFTAGRPRGGGGDRLRPG